MTTNDIRGNSYLSLSTANNRFDEFKITPKKAKWMGKLALSILLAFSVTFYSMARRVPDTLANPDTFYFDATASGVITGTVSWQFKTSGLAAKNTSSGVRPASGATGWYQYEPGVAPNTTADTESDHNADGLGWIYDTAYGSGVTIPTGTWSFRYSISPQTAGYCTTAVATIHFDVFKVAVSSGSISGYTFLFDFSGTTDIFTGADMEETITVSPNPSQVNFDDTQKYLYVEPWANVTTGCTDSTSSHRRINFDIAGTTTHGCSTTDCNMISPTVNIPENAIVYVIVTPFVPILALWMKRRKGINRNFDKINPKRKKK